MNLKFIVLNKRIQFFISSWPFRMKHEEESHNFNHIIH